VDKRGILDGLTIIDLGTGHAGCVAALLLAEAGADVLRIQPRQWQCPLQPGQAALWNRSKRLLELDLDQIEGRDQLNKQLDNAHLLISDLLPLQASQLGLSNEYLRRGREQLVLVNICGAPGSDLPVDDLLVMAHAGILDEQAAVGREGPVYLRFPLGSWHAAFLAAIGGLLRLRQGHVGVVQTSLLQGALIPLMMHWHETENTSPALQLGMPKSVPPTLFQCADGKWLHVMPDPNRAPEVRQALDALDPQQRSAANAEFAHQPITWFKDRGAMALVFRTRPRDEWLALLQVADVPADKVAAMGGLYLDEQACANGYVKEIDTAHGLTLQPAIPLVAEALDAISRWHPPARSAHQDFSKPLLGLNVVDLGAFVAGPLAPMLLADLGAEVIKVEPLNGDPMRVAEWPFNACQRGKRSLALNLKSPSAQVITQRLVEWADVIHHNQRMPAIERLGLGGEALLACKPDLIYCHVSAYGAKGPRRDWPGYDQLFQAASGWESESAGQGNEPTWLRFGMMDHLAGLASVLAVTLALFERDRCGKGQAVSSSLLAASLFTMESPADPEGRLQDFAHLDSDQLGVAPLRRLYPCRHGWIAVAQRPGDEHGLARVLTLAGVSNVQQLTATMAGLSVPEALLLFDDADVPAVEARTDQKQAFLDNPGNRRSGLVVDFPHSRYGRLTLPGGFWHFDDQPSTVGPLPPPLLGEHSRIILEELGFDELQINQWVAQALVYDPGSLGSAELNR
jgi:crotonobetainyl-CoA:carnitine CoA-transferase CaiB-like acyl-CoA transferase